MLAYTLDKVGNRTSVRDNGVATSYAYNALNELVSSTTASAKTSWTYDAAGNRFTQTAPTGVVTDYTYDSDDRMLTAGSTTFTYDDNGNRLTEVAPTGTTTYAYDANNRLLSVSAPTVASTFTYDGDGNRITQTVPSGTYSYVNDTATALPVVLNENGPDGAIDYGYGLGVLESLSSGFNYFYNLDGLGSVADLTNSKGTLVEAYSYDAWGDALTTAGSVGTKNKFGFTGQALDPGTGLYFLRARYYEPSSGRLLTKDPFPGSNSVSPTTNRYAYGFNNPGSVADPSGLWGIISFWGGAYDYGVSPATYGAAGQVQVGSGVFFGAGYLNFGRFLGGGGFVGGPGGGTGAPQQNAPVVVGRSAGLGAGFGFTNAGCAEDLAGAFDTYNVTARGIGISLALGGNGVVVLSFSPGAVGTSFSHYQTSSPIAQTLAGSVPSSCGTSDEEGAQPQK